MAMALPMATASGAVSSKIFKAMVHLDQDEDDFCSHVTTLFNTKKQEF